MEAKHVNEFRPNDVMWEETSKGLLRNPDRLLKNTDKRMVYIYNNIFFAKKDFTFGLRTVKSGEIHLIQTTHVPMLIYELPASSLKCRAANVIRRSFEPHDQMLYHRTILKPHTAYLIPAGTHYIVLTVQKTAFGLDIIPESLLSQLIQKGFHVGDFRKMKKFNQTPYKLPPPTPIHVPAEKRPLEENSLSKKRVRITPVMRRVCRRSELPMAPVQIPDVLESVHIPDVPQSPVQIPLVPQSSVQILDVLEPVQIPLVLQSPVQIPQSPVQIPVSQVSEPPVQISVSQVPEPPVQIPPVQIPDVPEHVQIPVSQVPQPPMQILHVSEPMNILHVSEPVQIPVSQVPQSPVQIPVSQVPQPPMQILHVSEPMNILHVSKPVQIPVSQVPQSPVQIPVSQVPQPPMQILHVSEPVQILHVSEPVQIPVSQVPQSPVPIPPVQSLPEPMQLLPMLDILDPLESTDAFDQLMSFVFGPQELQLLHTVPSIFDGDLFSFLDEFEREPMDLTMPRLNSCVQKSMDPSNPWICLSILLSVNNLSEPSNPCLSIVACSSLYIFFVCPDLCQKIYRSHPTHGSVNSCL
ncbi:uncharacterized protein TNCV_4495421 [Trichonephila clavipes]|nr:uncharacterized protein TNCV_4495421 [Trichonephila clavipes]